MCERGWLSSRIKPRNPTILVYQIGLTYPGMEGSVSRRKYRETAKKIQEVIGRRAVDQLAKQSGLVERKRKITGFRLLSALIAKVGSGMVEAIADIHREFNRA